MRAEDKGEDAALDMAVRPPKGLDPARSEPEVINGQGFCTATTTGADQETWEEYCALVQNDGQSLCPIESDTAAPLARAVTGCLTGPAPNRIASSRYGPQKDAQPVRGRLQ
jgi:hypothetical protein